MDFNESTCNMSLYVEDVQQQQQVTGSGCQGGRQESEEGMWESVIIKKDTVKNWDVQS